MITKEIDLGEYVITINYKDCGALSVEIFDELGEQIEGVYISDSDED